MRHPRWLLSFALSGGLSACAPNVVPPAPPPPLRVLPATPALRAEVLSLDGAVRTSFFGPDGRLYVPFGARVLVSAPGDLEHAEILPFRGALYPVGGRLFGMATSEGSEGWGASAFVELDWRLHEVQRLALGEAHTRVAVTPSGRFAFVSTFAGKGVSTAGVPASGLYRTSDFTLVRGDLPAPSLLPDRMGKLEASPDERFVVVGSRVVDVEQGKVAFSHRSLDRSTRVFEGGRLQWLYDDLLETVDLASGKRVTTWLPCSGPSAADAARAILYTACKKGLAKTTFVGGAPSTLVLAYPADFSVEGIRVEESGRVVLSKRAPEPEKAADSAPAVTLAAGGTVLEAVDRAPIVARLPYIEAHPPGQARCRIMQADGRPAPVPAMSCDATVSPDGRFVASAIWGGVVLTSLADAKTTTFGSSLGAAFNGSVTIEDGELVATHSEEPHDVKARIRLAPKKEQSSPLRVHMERRPEGQPVNVLVDHESVVLESAGAPIAKFPFEHYYNGTAVLTGGEIVVHGGRPGEPLRQPYHCKRDGHCEAILPSGNVLALAGAEALGALKVEGAFAFARVDLRTSATVTIPTPKEVTSVATVTDGWVLGLAGGTLAHVSRAKGEVDRVSDRAVAAGVLVVGAVGDRVALARFGPDVLLVDSATLAVTDHYVLGNAGHVHVDREGHYALEGDVADLESLVLCTDGHHVAPRAACRKPDR